MLGSTKHTKYWRTASFHTAWTQLTSLKDRLSLTVLRVICEIAGQWENPILQPRGHIPIRLNQSRKVETTAIQWWPWKVEIPIIETIDIIRAQGTLPHCITVTRRLTTGRRSEKWVVRRFRRCATS